MRNIPGFFERDVEIKKKAIIYTRKSKRDEGGMSLQSQAKICELYCDKNNMEIIKIYSEITPALQIENQKILKEIIENNSNFNLIVSEPSIFSQNMKDSVIMIDKMYFKNIILHCAVKKWISSNNSEYKKIINLIKDYESEILISKKEKIPDFGFRNVKYISDKTIIKIEIDYKEQKIIKLIKLLYNGGLTEEINLLLDYKKDNYEKKFGNMSYRSIANFLNNIGILNRGKKWNSKSISSLL